MIRAIHMTNGATQINDCLKNKLGIIIGGSGLVGGSIVHFFKKKWGCNILAPNSKTLSIRSEDDIKNYFASLRPDFIVNSAIASIDSNPQLAFEINYIGSINLARVARSLGIPYIFFSSAAVLPSGSNLSESDSLTLQPSMSNYAKSKLMNELTLEHLRRTEGLDYTIIRLAIVYGKHDHKIQGFHRLLFSVADQSMPLLFTRKGTCHSYTNVQKIPYFIRHILSRRDEFGGQIFHFVDQQPVELAQLILKIRDYLLYKRPKNIYLPYPIANFGVGILHSIMKLFNKIGIEARMPPELMFLKSFYEHQTLSADKLSQSSFSDPFPEETVYSQLPEMLQYYLTRWEQMNLISSFDKEFFDPKKLAEDFLNAPESLLTAIHNNEIQPFSAKDKNNVT